jgi:2-iminobutanoate/2-iminopropanoate deaminase
MPRQTINSGQAPQPAGPYAQAVRAGDLLFVSAQLPVDPMTNSLIRSGVRAQTRRALENIRAIVEAAGGTMASITRTTVYMKSLDDFAQMNEVYTEFFPNDPPARSTVEVARLPKDSLLAVDAIAHLGA